MKRTLTVGLLAMLLAAAATPAATASGDPRPARRARCGGGFRDAGACSFRYRGGQLYVGGSVRGAGTPEGAAAIRLEAVHHVTGERYVLLSCVTPGSGACAAGGSYDVTDDLSRGQRLFCIVEGHGRGLYQCGSVKPR